MSQSHSIRNNRRLDDGWPQVTDREREERFRHRERDQRFDHHDRDERGYLERIGDEVRAWFGDEEAEQRRRIDGRFEEERHREDEYPRSRERHEETRIRDVMTRHVITVHAWDTVERAARLMGEGDFGSLPVISDNGRLVGMVTDRDIALRIVARGKDPRRAQVEECMSRDVIACGQYDSLENCMRAMARYQIRRLPIVDDRDRIIGILSQGDLARHADKYPGRGQRQAFTEVAADISKPSGKARR